MAKAIGELNRVVIGERIRARRVFLGLSRESVADRIGVSTNFCRDIEIGAKGMSVATLARFTDVLKISSDYILFGKVSAGENHSLIKAMLDSVPEEKQKHVADLIRIFIQAME
jgi:transcriptional regulator with XRE-family HTH domain